MALAGCAVGPTYERPDVQLNANWVEQQDSRIATQTAPDAQWWGSFNDPVLNNLVELAYAQNLTLQVTGLRILEARARLGYAHGQRYPQVQVAVGGATVNEPSELALNTIQTGRFYDYQVGFDASWEIDFWSKYRKGVTAEESGYLATVADYDNALVSLASEVARTYTSLRTFEVLINLARENVVVQEAEQPIEHIYFPLDGMISMVAILPTGAAIEIAAVGREGAIGTKIGLQPQLAFANAIVQLPGNALRIDLGQFQLAARQSLAIAHLATCANDVMIARAMPMSPTRLRTNALVAA